MNEPINYMSTKDFIDLGFLQEANRLFFHPLGLALETQGGEGNVLARIWDYRDDPEGVIFEGLGPKEAASKAASVVSEAGRHDKIRRLIFNSDTAIQPLSKAIS